MTLSSPAPDRRSTTPVLEVLGCGGGSAPGRAPTSFLLGDEVAIDAGNLTAALELEVQARIRHVLLTHAHWDHLRDLPLFLDNTFRPGAEPVTVWGLDSVLEALKQHVFNDVIWPDLERFTPAAVRLAEVHPGDSFTLPAGDSSLEVVPFPSYHGVPATGYLIRYAFPRGDRNERSTETPSYPTSSPPGARRAALALTTDTGFAPAFFEALARTADLTALVIEVSFPNRLEELAKASHHLTPALLGAGLGDVLAAHPALRVCVSHLKPSFEAEVREELSLLDLPLRILAPGDRIGW